MHNMQDWTQGGADIRVGECLFLADSTDVLLTLDNMTFLKSGSLIVDDAANYPDVFAQFGYTPSQRPYAWAALNGGPSTTVDDAMYNNGVWICVRHLSNGLPVLLRSTDRTTWTTIGFTGFDNLTKYDAVTAIAAGGGKFVVACYIYDQSKVIIYRSSDAITWATSSQSVSSEVRGFVYSGSTFALIDSGARIHTSPDGATWTLATSGVFSGTKKGFYVANGQILISGLNGTAALTYQSTTYTSFTARTALSNLLAASEYITGLAYGNGLYVLTTSAGQIITSTNMTTSFTAVSGLSAGALKDVIYFNGEFLAIGAKFCTSFDGVNWISRPLVFPSNASGIRSDGSTNLLMITPTSLYLPLNKVVVGISAPVEQDGMKLYMRVK